MTLRPLVLLIPMATLLACSDKGAGKNDTGSADGGDGDDGGIVYEEGCILVDGAGGYAWINDAVAVASEGSTIELCASAGHEEAVVIDKAVSVVGPGVEDFVLIAPTNMAAVTITGTGASLSGMTIQSSRSGVKVTAADGVQLSALSLIGVGNWGIHAEDSADLVVEAVSLLGNGVDGINYGGIRVAGGSADISASTLSGNTGYGLWADEGADVTVQDSDLSNNIEFDIEDDTTDGIGAYATAGAALSSVNNVYTGNGLGGGWADGASLSMTGDAIYSSVVGAYVANGAASFTDVRAEDILSVGLLAVGEDPIVLSNCSVSADPVTSASADYDAFPSATIAGSGVLVSGMDITLSDLTVTGFNNAGLYLEGQRSGATATVNRAAISNTGRYGIFVNNGIVADLTDVTVADTRLVDDISDRLIDLDGDGSPDTDPLCYYVNYWAAVYNSQSTLTWNGGGVTGSEGWGFSNLRGSLDLQNATMGGAFCSGIVSLESVLSVTDSTFLDKSGDGHIISSEDSVFILSRNLFTSNQAEGEVIEEYDYEELYGYRLTYTYAPGYAGGYDVQAFGSRSVEITDNQFEDGEMGLYLAGLTGRVEDNSWTNYWSTALTVGASSNSDGSINRGDLVIDNASFDGVNGRSIYCSSANVEVGDLSVTDGGDYAYSYDYLYEYDSDGDGTLDASYSFSSTSTSSNVGLLAYGCNLLGSDLAFSDLSGNAMEIYTSGSDSSSIDLIGIDVENTGTDSIYSEAGLRFYASSGALDINLSDVTISGVAQLPGLSLYSTSTGTIAFEADGVSIADVGQDGINLRGRGVTANITDLDIDGAGDNGIENFGSTLTVTGTRIANSAGHGLSFSSDADGDGWSVGQGDCHDGNSSIHPGMADVANLVDDNCDGITDDSPATSDNDGDGYSPADGDCDDSSSTGATRSPGLPEIMGNGIDDDCDGVADDGENAHITLTGLSIEGNGGDGISVLDAWMDVRTNTVSGNGGWGMVCETSTFSSCAGNSLLGNALGGQSGCDESCGL